MGIPEYPRNKAPKKLGRETVDFVSRFLGDSCKSTTHHNDLIENDGSENGRLFVFLTQRFLEDLCHAGLKLPEHGS
jgi:hypothetical protein